MAQISPVVLRQVMGQTLARLLQHEQGKLLGHPATPVTKLVIFESPVKVKGENSESQASRISSWILKMHKAMIWVLRPPVFRISEDVKVSP